MKSSEVVEYTTALVAFVNCVIISTATLNDRIRIRNEFLGLKILEVLNQFRKQCKNGANSDLAVQLDVFDEQRSTDEGQFSGPDGVDLSSHMDVFFAILRQIAETPQEIPFLSILQHLLRTDLSQPLSEVVWETAETLVHRATLLESKQEADRLLRASNLGGLMRCHCSCHYKSTTSNTEDCDVTPNKRNRPTHLSFCSSDGVRTPGSILSPSLSHPPPTPYDTAASPMVTSCVNDAFKSPTKGLLKQNSEFFPNAVRQNSIAEQIVPTKNNAIYSQCCNSMSKHQTSDVLLNDESQDHSSISAKCNNKPSNDTVSSSVPNSNLESSNCDQGHNTNNDIISQIQINGQISQNIPPPPPLPPQSTGGMPLPPPPPPPPPSFAIAPQIKKSAVETTLPQQNTPKPKTKMKSFNWSKIPVNKVIGKDNLWSRVAKDHTGSPNDLDFDVMEGLFCQQPVTTNGHVSPKFGDSSDNNDKKKKEIQEINLLDGKRSLNINIFLKQFRSSHENIVRILEDGAHEDLGAERLRGLLKILPESDEAEMLRNFDGDKSKLGNAEKFLLQLLDVPNYKLRIESMLLKEEFMANQEFLENSIETIRCAVQELEECRKLHEILYMVLVAGNFLNAGGYGGNAAGFKMLSLLKLTDIRANKPSVTLIHYVAEQVTKKRPDLLTFIDEVQNLEEASKISMETLKTDVSSLIQRVSRVSSQVANAEQQIKSQMQEFLQFAENKVETIQNEINNLESVRQKLADFLCEDTDTFKLEDCFKVFHNFCTRFKAAVQENERRQKQEKLAEARRKQREEHIALKRRSLELPDSRSGIDADHIMDQLLGDIRSGFPERRLGDIYRKGKKSPDPDDTSTGSNRTIGAHSRSEMALKRHSDPAMIAKCYDTSQQDERSGIVKSRRARFLDEANGDEIIDYLQNPSAVDEQKERRTFGTSDDGGFERIPVRRSGRRKRDVLNGEIQTRERNSSSPPPSLPVVEDTELEASTKQKLKAKINEWMLQNEREQKRDRDLQIRLQQERKKRQHLNGQNLLNSDGDNGIAEEADEVNLEKQAVCRLREIDLPAKNNCDDGEYDVAKITKAALSRQTESFTQKIIGLLDAASHETKAFDRSRLYHSTRETPSRKHEMTRVSRDDAEVSRSIVNSSSLIDSAGSSFEQTPSPSSSDPESVKTDDKNASKISTNPFDRFSATRKTQRRIKLREMRIEAENTILASTVKTKESKNLSQQSFPLSVVSNNPQVDVLTSNETFASSNIVKTAEHETQLQPEVDYNSSVELSPLPAESAMSSNDGAPGKDNVPFSNRRSTSLRSRQSRLARRIDSLTTPLTSPLNENAESSLSDMNKTVLPSKPNLETCANGNEDHLDTSPCSSKEPHSSDKATEEKNGKPNIDEKSENAENPQQNTNSMEHPSNTSPPESVSAGATNGNVSHEVTVSTETESKVIMPKSSLPPNRKTVPQLSKSKVNIQKVRTSIPSVIKTTQNVKVQQTVSREPVLTEGKTTQRTVSQVSGKRVLPPSSKTGTPTSCSPCQSPSVTKRSQINSKGHNKIPNIISNGKSESDKNGKESRSSSISSLCSLRTNLKIVKKSDQNATEKTSQSVNAKKITINHNGSVKFVKKSSGPSKTANTPGNSNSTKSVSETSRIKQESSIRTRRKVAT
ncbi:uncharacterized protein LOC118200800 [Stegodyphus dumicola]|uniref:uncharacterized protein LOC118200800 n=1 Tax=Stegodyphus dumicola TaxID=202533 RepID=UPI0015AA52DC|nr:uncharacterized protein LOC118200800 [Stegodyphus dumicola]